MFDTDVFWLEERKGNRQHSAIDIQKTEALGWSYQCDVKEYIKTVLELAERVKTA